MATPADTSSSASDFRHPLCAAPQCSLLIHHGIRGDPAGCDVNNRRLLRICLREPGLFHTWGCTASPRGAIQSVRMVTCPGCGTVSSENVRFCPSCGRAVSILDTPTLEPDRNAVAPVRIPISSHPPRSGGFSPGTVLVERYRIVALLGRGGMGEVYRAEDLKLGNVVALKFLPASLQDDTAALEGFHAEVRNARQVSHPNVCRVYDIGEVNGQHFLTMEYIDGEDLTRNPGPTSYWQVLFSDTHCLTQRSHAGAGVIIN